MEKEAKKHFWDCERAETRMTPHFRAASEVLSILTFLGGGAVLAGWALDIPVLKSVLPGLVTMKANTALCFVFLGLSLWLLQTKRRDNRLCQTAAQVSGCVVLVIGLLTLFEYLLGCNLGIDQLLFKELSGAILTSSPGRMAFNTAINFTVTGLALIILASKTKNRCFFAQILMCPVGILSALAFIGYLYHAAPLFIGLHFSTAMALHTAVFFLVSYFGLLFCRPGCGLMVPVSSDALGGKLIRRLLPITILIPLTLGWVNSYFEKNGRGSPAFSDSFVATGNLTIISLCVYVLASFLNKAEALRRRAEEALRESEKRFMDVLYASKDAILLIDGDKFVDCNEATARMLGYSSRKEFLMTHPSELSPPQQPDGKSSFEKANEMIKAAFAEGFHRFEWTHKKANGKNFPVEVSLTPISIHGKNVLHCLWRDLTEFKKELENSREREEELRRWHELTLDREDRVQELKREVNDLCRHLGRGAPYSSEETGPADPGTTGPQS